MLNKEKDKCKICGSEVNLLFKSLVLSKYQVSYFKCPNCEFIQTEKPFWFDEAYNNAITDLDVGLVSRNLSFSNVIENIIKNNFDVSGKFLDYAGGYGLFVRLMRDKGFDFYREDKYCKNIFAKNYDLEDLGVKNKFELVTAFEVFEHLEDPLMEIEKMFKYSDTVIFSTELQPSQNIKSNEEWWYFTPETGQHIAFYSAKTLEYIAEKLHFSFYSIGNMHLMSKKKFKGDPFLSVNGGDYKNEMLSLIQADFEFAKSIIAKVDNIKKEIDDTDEGIEECHEEKLVRRLSLANVKQDALTLKLESAKTKLSLTEKELNLSKADLSSIKAELDLVKEELNLTSTALDSTKKELNSTNAILASTKSKLDVTVAELRNIYASREWKMAMSLRKFVSILIPKMSLRRKIAVSFWRGVKLCIKACLRAMRSFKKYIIKLKPEKRRKINLKSKKLVYVGHSYHNKTKSTVFLIDYLKKFFDVEVVLDESWLGKPFPDLSFIDESYLGVIFFQNLPNQEIFRSVKNDNLIFFPMYDASGGLDFDFWNSYQHLKIINFSKTLHKKLDNWGFESIYVQYFPEKLEFAPGKKDEMFFWQRLTRININTITKLFNDSNLKIHIHKAIDPNQEFIHPRQEDEKKFQISYSDWFETRDEMWDLIKQKGIYVAPREFEGIGMSFLEAMAMGKAVVAVNNPTMNEYIEHGKTGYLFDLENPKKIDLSNIQDVQKSTYEYMQKGFEKWEQDKHIIIDFIKHK